MACSLWNGTVTSPHLQGSVGGLWPAKQPAGGSQFLSPLADQTPTAAGGRAVVKGPTGSSLSTPRPTPTRTHRAAQKGGVVKFEVSFGWQTGPRTRGAASRLGVGCFQLLFSSLNQKVFPDPFLGTDIETATPWDVNLGFGTRGPKPELPNTDLGLPLYLGTMGSSKRDEGAPVSFQVTSPPHQ